MYADYLLLLALSSHGLQQMINICEKEFVTLDIKVNVKRSTHIGVLEKDLMKMWHHVL